MERFRGNFVMRLLAGIAFGVLFLAGGLFFVRKFLTPDLMLRQQLAFIIPESCRDPFAAQWAAFAREQQAQLLNLAQENLPYLARYVSVIPQTKNPIITLQLRCPLNQDENICLKFEKLVATYALATAEARISRIENKLAQIQMQILQLKAQQVKYRSMLSGERERTGPDDTASKITQDPIIRNDQRNVRQPSEIFSFSDGVFDARLDLSKTNIAKSKPFSRFQQFVLVVFALAGFLVGIGPPGGYLHSHEEESEETPREIARSVTSPSRELTLLSSTTFNTTTATEAVVTIPKKKTRREPEKIVLPVLEEFTVDEAEIETLPLAQPKEKDIIEGVKPEAETVRKQKSREKFPDEPAESAPKTQSEEILDEKSKSIFEQEEISGEKPVAMIDQEEIENHSRQQEILLSENLMSKKKKEIDRAENSPQGSVKAESKPLKAETDTINVKPVSPSKPQTKPSPKPVLSELEESMVTPEQESIPVVAIDLNKDMPTAQAAGTAGAARSKYDTLADLIEKLRPQTPCPVIVVSALKPKDVSPRLTVNLAVTLIRRALRVLIVEADPSHKELATLFGLPQEPGFFEWRRGAAWISHTTHRTQLVGLSVMPAGIPRQQQEDPDLELWREKHRWRNLANDFDVVLLYYPSALSENPQTPEQIMGVHLRNMTHGVLALTRSPKQIEIFAQTVVDNLADHNAQLLAIVPIKA